MKRNIYIGLFETAQQQYFLATECFMKKFQRKPIHSSETGSVMKKIRRLVATEKITTSSSSIGRCELTLNNYEGPDRIQC